MLKFLAIVGGILAACIAAFMIMVNLNLVDLSGEKYSVEKKQIEESVEQDEQTEQAENIENTEGTTEENDKTTDETEDKKETQETKKVNENGYEDGVYIASEKDFDLSTGWKKEVEVEIRNGKIYDVDWNEVYKDGGKSKKELSEAGEYMMTEQSIPWHKQVQVAEQYVLDISNPESVEAVDTISSVTIDVSDYMALVIECLNKAKAS